MCRNIRENSLRLTKTNFAQIFISALIWFSFINDYTDSNGLCGKQFCLHNAEWMEYIRNMYRCASGPKTRTVGNQIFIQQW